VIIAIFVCGVEASRCVLRDLREDLDLEPLVARMYSADGIACSPVRALTCGAPSTMQQPLRKLRCPPPTTTTTTTTQPQSRAATRTRASTSTWCRTATTTRGGSRRLTSTTSVHTRASRWVHGGIFGGVPRLGRRTDDGGGCCVQPLAVTCVCAVKRAVKCAASGRPSPHPSPNNTLRRRRNMQIAGVREILTSVVQSLLEAPERRFSWGDVGFFIRWAGGHHQHQHQQRAVAAASAAAAAAAAAEAAAAAALCFSVCVWLQCAAGVAVVCTRTRRTHRWLLA